MTIALIGATGTTGREVFRHMNAARIPVRCIVRDTDRAEQVLGSGSELVKGDLDDPATIETGCTGCDTLFLLSAHNPQLGAQHIGAIDAALRAGVGRIVKLAGMMTNPDMRIPAEHGKAERHLQDCGASWAIVRPNFFMQNLFMMAPGVREQGKVIMAFPPDIPISMIDVRDSGEICAGLLAEPDHANRIYELTGELVTLEDAAAKLSEALGRQIPYIQAPLDKAKAVLREKGAPDWAADHLGNIVQAITDGDMSKRTAEVEKLLGRPATTLSQFMFDHSAQFS